MTKSALKPKQAKSFNSSRVIGPVVSWLPTVVIFGSQYVPGRTPLPSGKPHARPTIFCAKVKPLPESTGGFGKRKVVAAGKPKKSRALEVNERPIIKLIRPPACTSSNKTSLFNWNVSMV